MKIRNRFALASVSSPIPLLSHHVYSAYQPIGGVTPIGLNGALGGAGISRTNSLDYGVVLSSSGCHRVEQKRDIHPDVPLRLRFHGVVQRAKAGTRAGLDVTAVKFLIELI